MCLCSFSRFVLLSLSKTSHYLKAISHIHFIQNSQKSMVVRNLSKQRCIVTNTNSLTLWMSAEAPADRSWLFSNLWDLSWMSSHQKSDQSEFKTWHHRPPCSSAHLCLSSAASHPTCKKFWKSFFFFKTSVQHFLSNSSIPLSFFKKTSLFPCFIENHPPVPQTVVTDIVSHLHSAETS